MTHLLNLLRRVGPVLGLSAFILILWEVLTALDTSRARIIPRPTEVIAALARNIEVLVTRHIPITLLETLIGLVIALVLGVVLAALLDLSGVLRRAVYPLLIVSQTVPVIAIAPVLLLVFGFGVEPKVVVVVLFCFFPITVAMLDGLTSTNPDLVVLMRALNATRWQTWRKVRLPSALPGLFSGLRIAATYSVSGAIVGEFVTAQYGLGQFLRNAYSTQRIDQGFAAIVITAALSVGLVVVVTLAERWLMPWYFTSSRAWDTHETD